MYCIGLISGTSVDGIDAALVEITGTGIELQVKLIAEETFPYPIELREQILAVCGGQSLSMAEFAELDDAIATQFALAAQKIQTGNPPAQLIGSHGQTVFHRPPFLEERENQSKIGYSLQLGRGEVIANLTGIPTVYNFRAADIAAGGQGAPMVSKVDACLLSHPTLYRCVQNIGGIGNVTYLPARQQNDWEESVCGWDTGPGNALLDLAVSKLTGGRQTFDKDGNWAAQGMPAQELIERWLAHDFFQQSPPKSTGRELFSEAYLDTCWQEAQIHQLSEADWLATLTEFTVASIVHSYRTFLPRMPDEVLLCGGGSRNRYLKRRLEEKLAGKAKVLTTDEVGISADAKEAIAFAVLAYWRFCCSFPGNLVQVTGAKQPTLLGEIHLPITT
ncbi:molecular chaperone [Pleurocapsa sp. PCC 7327]|uniref:anhydro-N-acetylmuramic acid kinase n=1 Tax=Pleurocapsa sp. PCC 7327 TaxID=118163 RepID=UPI00029FB081|nr:anhydro-N-acetylmuramic acid kinase [Pleurocapsa sp. PCC 7327]AFY77616.1 molecular chaperone [Pleurocapsa sp. PCC 7327]